MQKTKVLSVFFAMSMLFSSAIAQTVYDSKTLVDTNSTSTSTSTINTNNVNSGTITNNNNTSVTSTSTNVNTNNNVQSGTLTNINQNTNVNSGTMTYNNNNVNSGTMTNNNNNVNTSVSTNTNINSGTMTNNNNNVNTSTSTSTNTNINNGTMTNNNVNTGDMTNRNINTTTANTTNANVNQNINSGDMTNRNINDTNITQRVIQPPPTSIAPSMMSGGNNDLCTTGTSGSVQTQIFGVSSGGTVRDLNCERLKLSKTLYDMGMKVAAVATMCQDRRVFDAMMAAGTPCPYEGKIGEAAKVAWETNPEKLPKLDEVKEDDTYKKIGIGSVLGIAVFKLFGL